MGCLVATDTAEHQRTAQQRKALEVYCHLVAEAMNDAGYDFKKAITLEIDMTQELVKEYVFKVIMRAMYPSKTSTTQLSTTEIQKVYEVMNANTANKFGVSMDWPSDDPPMIGLRHS